MRKRELKRVRETVQRAACPLMLRVLILLVDTRMHRLLKNKEQRHKVREQIMMKKDPKKLLDQLKKYENLGTCRGRVAGCVCV